MGSLKEYYIEQYRQLHKKKKYGTSSATQQLTRVQNLIDKIKPQSILDYGCGQSDLWRLIKGCDVIDRYDPAIEGLDDVPTCEFDLVLCTDVLEHVPEEAIDELLTTLHKLGKEVYVVISCSQAAQCLPNGENAHITIKPQQWWVKKLEEHWEDMDVNLARPSYVSATLRR